MVSIAIGNSTFVLARNDTVTFYDISSGEEISQTKLKGSVLDVDFCCGKYAITVTGGYVHVIQEEGFTGKPIFISKPYSGSVAVLEDGFVACNRWCGYFDERGEIKEHPWFDIPIGSARKISVSGGQLYVALKNYYLDVFRSIIEVYDIETDWSKSLMVPPEVVDFAVDKNYLVVSNGYETLAYQRDDLDEPFRTFNLPAETIAALQYGFVATIGRRLYFIDVEKGRIKKVPLPCQIESNIQRIDANGYKVLIVGDSHCVVDLQELFEI